jgi:hypothetical protein
MDIWAYDYGLSKGNLVVDDNRREVGRGVLPGTSPGDALDVEISHGTGRVRLASKPATPSIGTKYHRPPGPKRSGRRRFHVRRTPH